MKIKLLSALTIAAGLSSLHAQTVVDLTGSTAGRASVHAAILTTLSNVTYGYQGSSLDGATYAIFKGTFGGNPVTVRTSWSGSATGLSALSTGIDVNFIPTTTNITANNVSGLPNGSDPSASEVAFSDVFVGSTTVPATGLVNTNTFVIPFKWIASNKANSITGFTNVTPLQARALLKGGTLPASLFTGNSANASITVVATGRDNGSGTRITTLADIGYGVNTEVVQADVLVGTGPTANDITGFADFPAGPNGGYSSGGTLAGKLNKQSIGDTADFVVLAYLGLSDANTALGGTFPGKELTYNGVAYSADNVYNGKYSLWGYLHLYYKDTLAGTAKNFSDALAVTLKTIPGSSGLNPASMNVSRTTDGGNINPL